MLLNPLLADISAAQWVAEATDLTGVAYVTRAGIADGMAQAFKADILADL